MIQFSLRLSRSARRMASCSSWFGIAAATVMAGAPALAAPLPYPQAVSNSQVAARAVLGRAGREHCLRGKLTRALLGLSNSCEASGNRSPLCALADRAVVVTPMTLTFMDETARQLLELIPSQADAGQAAAGPSATAAPLAAPVP